MNGWSTRCKAPAKKNAAAAFPLAVGPHWEWEKGSATIEAGHRNLSAIRQETGTLFDRPGLAAGQERRHITGIGLFLSGRHLFVQQAIVGGLVDRPEDPDGNRR